MKGLYRNLALSGIRGSRRTYLPYLLACSGMIMMYYIVAYLKTSDMLVYVPGGMNMKAFLKMGTDILTVFSLIFLFYTHSFLIRRRKKEFGLYNILGLGKRNIAAVLFIETLIIAAITIAAGLFFGILFSKFAELAMIRVLNIEASFDFSISFVSVRATAVLFLAIDGIIFCDTLRQIQLTDPIRLLHSESYGEKPPKANWLLALAGVILLGAAYYIAVSIQDPVSAISFFFLAVTMVILATYLLFMAGSVTLCRLLQKNRRYYYRTNHFISVSSMSYRMKRNGAGLASICILCTMVLVMLSFTTCLYSGLEHTLRVFYPRNVCIDLNSADSAGLSAAGEEIRRETEAVFGEYGVSAENVLSLRFGTVTGVLSGDTVYAARSNDASAIDSTYMLYLVPYEDYCRLTGEDAALGPQETVMYITDGTAYPYDEITLEGCGSLSVTAQTRDFAPYRIDTTEIVPSIYLFVSDFDAFTDTVRTSFPDKGIPLETHWFSGMDLSADDDLQSAVTASLSERLSVLLEGRSDAYVLAVDCVANSRATYTGLYGGCFFLSVMLGTVFTIAAVLIIYYKQVTEGYEDQARFTIMQKVGMTRKEIRKSINSQILTVFFLPLLTAGLHLCFAFPLLQKILRIFSVTDRSFLITVTCVTYLVFALFYVAVYRITSHSYYRIVADMKTGR